MMYDVLHASTIYAITKPSITLWAVWKQGEYMGAEFCNAGYFDLHSVTRGRIYTSSCIYNMIHPHKITVSPNMTLLLIGFLITSKELSTQCEKRINNRIHAALSRLQTEGVTLQRNFFAGSHLPLPKVLALVYFWVAGNTVVQTMNHVGMSSANVVQRHQYFRNKTSVCGNYCTHQLCLEDRRVIQIDESVMVKAKYHCGCQLWERHHWVFWIYDPEQKIGHIELGKTPPHCCPSSRKWWRLGYGQMNGPLIGSCHRLDTCNKPWITVRTSKIWRPGHALTMWIVIVLGWRTRCCQYISMSICGVSGIERYQSWHYWVCSITWLSDICCHKQHSFYA